MVWVWLWVWACGHVGVWVCVCGVYVCGVCVWCVCKDRVGILLAKNRAREKIIAELRQEIADAAANPDLDAVALRKKLAELAERLAPAPFPTGPTAQTSLSLAPPHTPSFIFWASDCPK